MTRSLYEDIDAGKFPSWDVYGQIISPEVAERYPINIFDPTKTLPSKDFPYRPFGRIVLDRNVDDHFAETEQSAFSPTNVVPGWALSPDPSMFPSNFLAHYSRLMEQPSPANTSSGIRRHAALQTGHKFCSAASEQTQVQLQPPVS